MSSSGDLEGGVEVIGGGEGREEEDVVVIMVVVVEEEDMERRRRMKIRWRTAQASFLTNLNFVINIG